MKFHPGMTTSTREEPGGFFARLNSQYDFLQFGVVLALLAVGFLFIYTVGQNNSQEHALGIIWRQVWWVVLGGGAWLLLANIDYRELKVLSWIFYIVCIILLILVLEIGLTIMGATRWLALPGGMRLQPSEFTKLAMVMTLGTIMTTMNFSINRFWSLLLIFGLTLLPFLLIIKEPDLGSALILVPVALTLVFACGLKWRYILLGSALIIVVASAFIVNEFSNDHKGIYPMLKWYQKERILTFLYPERDLKGSGANAWQARLAVGSGGMFGKGIGKGTVNSLGFLPHSVSNNDFIFSVIAEETGFAGCLVLLGLYGLLLYSIIRSAMMAPDDFGKYLGAGIAAIFFVHIYVNIGMSIGLTPITGLSLPLVSYGGSFIVVSMTCLGIMQSVYRHGIGAGPGRE